MKIQVLERCFALLDLLRLKPHTLSELSEATDVQATTLRNILRTLEELEIVGRDGKKYKLGPKLHDYMLPGQGERPHAAGRSIVRHIGSTFGHPVCLVVLNGEAGEIHLEVLAVHPGRQKGAGWSEGDLWPHPHRHPAGRLLLANLPDDQFNDWLERQEAAEREMLRTLLLPLRGERSCFEVDGEQQIACGIELVHDSHTATYAAVVSTLPLNHAEGERHKVRELLPAAVRAASAESDSASVPLDSVGKKAPAPANAVKEVEAPVTAEPIQKPQAIAPPKVSKEEPKPESPVRRSWAGFRNG